MGTSSGIVVNCSLAGLYDAKDSLAVVSACLVLSLEGSHRATATEIAERTARDFHVSRERTRVGQIVRALGLSTTLANGKVRFKLDSAQLKSLEKQYKTAINSTMAQIKAIVAEYRDYPARIAELEQEVVKAAEIKKRERFLREQIDILRQYERALPTLEAENNRLQAVYDKYQAEKEREKRLYEFKMRFGH